MPQHSGTQSNLKIHFHTITFRKENSSAKGGTEIMPYRWTDVIKNESDYFFDKY